MSKLKPKDRELISWFIREHLKLQRGWEPDEDKWIACHHSWGRGGRGWEGLRQGATGAVSLVYWYQHMHRPGSKEWRPAIIIRAALEAANGIKATEYLKSWLSTYHSDYTIEDVATSCCAGYLICLKPCKGGYPCKQELHYHTLSIPGIRGYGRGRYAFWRALKAGGIIHHEEACF